jgi:hypothetical protein
MRIKQLYLFYKFICQNWNFVIVNIWIYEYLNFYFDRKFF